MSSYGRVFGSRLFDSLRAHYESRSERDRRALTMGVALVTLVLVAGGLITLNLATLRALDSLTVRQALWADLPSTLDRVQRQSRLGADLALPTDELARRVSRVHAIESVVDVSTPGVVRLRATQVPFDAVMDMLGDLEAASVGANRIHLRAATAGRVDVELELRAR